MTAQQQSCGLCLMPASEHFFSDGLLVGSQLQDDVFDILVRSECFKVAMSVDVPKVVEQVASAKKDKIFHRIL